VRREWSIDRIVSGGSNGELKWWRRHGQEPHWQLGKQKSTDVLAVQDEEGRTSAKGERSEGHRGDGLAEAVARQACALSAAVSKSVVVPGSRTRCSVSGRPQIEREVLCVSA
jgi:hypothetical protein